MADKIIKESYLLAAPFEEDKTSQSEHKPFNNNSKFVPPSLNLDIKESNILDLKYESESPSPTKTPNETLVRFEIKNHEILKKEDYVVYYINVTIGSKMYMVQQRYNSFRELNNRLGKNLLIRDKIPELPPTRFRRKSMEVIEERKKYLNQYLTKLSQKINIFGDDDVIKFLRLEKEVPHLLSNLRDQWENNRANRLGAKKILQLNEAEKEPESGCSTKSNKILDRKNMQGLMGDISNMSKLFNRNRGKSDDVDLLPSQSLLNLAKQVSTNAPLEEVWSLVEFSSLDDKIMSFIEHLHKNPENQSQLIADFHEFYLCRIEKPQISSESLKRLFFGSIQRGGLLAQLQECHQVTSGVKTKAVLNLFKSLMDNNKSHQVDEIKTLWRSQKPSFVQECHFEKIILKENSLKECAYVLLQTYIDGRLTIEKLLKDEMACQKFSLFINNKGRVQKSFASSNSGCRNLKVKAQRGKLQVSKSFSDMKIHKIGRHTTTAHNESFTSNENGSGSNPNTSKKNQKKGCTDSFGQKIQKKRRMFMSGYRVSETVGNNNNSNSILYDSEEDGDSISEGDLQSSSSDMLDQIDDINDFMFKVRERRASMTVQLPKDMCPQIVKADTSSIVFELVPQDEGQDRHDLFEFDIQHEINELIKRYLNRINIHYHHYEIENLQPKAIQGQINKYIFTQTDVGNQYKIKLKNFRRAIEGVKFAGMMNHGWDNKNSSSSDATNKPDDMIRFFDLLDVQVVKEIDEGHKIIKFSANRKYSEHSDEIDLKTHLMLVSYQIINDERATISLFEYDEEKQQINPLNFIIVSQKIDQSKLHQDDALQYRTLSAVLEDPHENDVGSFTLKQRGFNFKRQSGELSKIQQHETPQNNSLEDVKEEDQDELLFESTFSYQDNKAGEEKPLQNSYTEQEEPVIQPAVPTKTSMSTAKSSSGPQGQHFSDIAAQFDFLNQKNINNPFDKTLDALTGNISVTMRIQDDNVILEKILGFYTGLAEKINQSLHNVQ